MYRSMVYEPKTLQKVNAKVGRSRGHFSDVYQICAQCVIT